MKTPKSKITSGDWTLLRWGKEINGHPLDAGHVIQADDGKLAVDICKLHVCSVTTEHGTRKKRKVSRAESLANGRLLAGAPALLAACRDALAFVLDGQLVSHQRNPRDPRQVSRQSTATAIRAAIEDCENGGQ